LEYAIRPMREGDLDQVLEIEALSFPIPWSRYAFASELKENAFAYYLVCQDGEQVVGYAGMWVILDEAHITNVAVHPDHRRRGVGQMLMLALEEAALARGATRITLEVRVSNTAAQQLYEMLGYRRTGVRRAYYTDNKEDALIMWKVFTCLESPAGIGRLGRSVPKKGAGLYE